LITFEGEPVMPTTPEFYVVFRSDTMEVLWFSLTLGEAHKAAKYFSLKLKDVPVSYTLAAPDPEEKETN